MDHGAPGNHRGQMVVSYSKTGPEKAPAAGSLGPVYITWSLIYCSFGAVSAPCKLNIEFACLNNMTVFFFCLGIFHIAVHTIVGVNYWSNKRKGKKSPGKDEVFLGVTCTSIP